MPAILRIDVDKPFLVKKSFTKRTCLFYSLEYLKPCKELIKGLNSRGIKASLFFQPFTVPNKEFAQELMREGHSIGLHAVHTRDYKVFSRDLNRISKSFNGTVYGFTKHGSGKRWLT